MKLPEDVREFFRNQGARGGKTRARNLTPQERRESAARAAKARWNEERRKKKSARTGRTVAREDEQ